MRISHFVSMNTPKRSQTSHTMMTTYPPGTVSLITPETRDVPPLTAPLNMHAQDARDRIQPSCAATSQKPAAHPHLQTVDHLSHQTTTTSVQTPVNPEKLNELLQNYPHRQYIIDGLTYGFKLNFEGPESTLASKNSPSLYTNIHVARKKINQELSLGRIAGPFTHPPFKHFKSSPLALREKSTPGKYRLLHNLSYPYDNNSVNFNIPRQYTTVKYQNIHHAITLIQNHAPAAFMSKSDISDAFRIIPLHPSQYHLMGFSFDNKFYYDRMLPMGAAPSCKIFEDFSDAIVWILHHKYHITDVVKVLDDFIFISSDRQTSQDNITTFISLCNYIGVPIAHHKTEGPTNVITFLGIELDSLNMEARLPQDKLTNYSTNLRQMASADTITLRQLKSLTGQLSFASSVIPSGRAFLRRLHNLTIGKTNPNSLITLSTSSKLDLLTWATFLSNYNGRTIIRPISTVNSAEIQLCADASKLGFGATYGKSWIEGTWPSTWKTLHITFLELFPIFLTITMFAAKLKNSHITFYSDNMGVVHILNKQTSKCHFVMQLIRPLVLTLLHHNIQLKSAHIPGILNTLCDSISRQQVTPALLQQYGLHPHPTPLPAHLRPENYKLNWDEQ